MVVAVFFTPRPIAVLVTAVFGSFAVISVASALSRKVALRVDAAGVTLGGGPFRYEATTRFHPWDSIAAITLWKRYFPVTIGRWTPFSLGPLRYIGLRRIPGAPPITPAGRGRADGPAYMAPVTGIAAGAARNISAFAVDRAHLAERCSLRANSRHRRWRDCQKTWKARRARLVDAMPLQVDDPGTGPERDDQPAREPRRRLADSRNPMYKLPCLDKSGSCE